MLVKAPLVDNGLKKLHEEISYFISQIGIHKAWSKALFHNGFYKEVVSKNSELEKRLKKFWEEFNKLPSDRKDEILEEFNAYNSIKYLCNNKQSITIYWKDSAHPDFTQAVKNLFIWMYGATLERVSYKSFSGESLRDHYFAYRRVYNLAMCPFCGLEDYNDLSDELETRDAYDHYLDKASYPFAAVNPDNLFPMCHTCNSEVKKTQDVLHEDGTSIRRLAPYPPDDVFQISIQVSDALLPKPIVSIALTDENDPQAREKFNTWLIVFQMRQRYEGRVKKKKKDWLTDIIVKLDSRTTDIDTDLPKKLKVSYEECRFSLMVEQQREHHIKAAFLSYCISNVRPVISFCKAEPAYTRYLTNRSKVLNN